MFRTQLSNLSIPLAFLMSLALHLVGLAIADRVRESQRIGLTESLPDPAPRNDAADEPDEAEREEITPGIQDGAEATMTWIGYDEYREHIARLAESEQAAFTSAEARGVPDGERIVETETKSLEFDGERAIARAQGQPIQQDSPPPSGLETNAAETANASGNELVAGGEAAPAVDEPIAATEPSEDAAVIPETGEEDGIFAQGEAATDLDSAMAREAAAAQARQLMNEAFAQVERLIAEAVASGEEAGSDVEMVIESRRDAARPPGEPTAPDAAPSEKDSEATSVIDAPKDAWTSGRPLAIEGLEVRPYNLFRHIVVDSNDRMFLHDISGVIERNPVVSLRFDRRGVAGEVRVLRKSGYAPFDRLYLTTWMARWTANGEQLKSLSGDELSPPIVFKLVFVKEAKNERAEDDTP